MNVLQELDDEIMGLEAQLLGKRMERAYAAGERNTAMLLQQQMVITVQRRKALRGVDDGCYFADAGDSARRAAA